MEFPRIHSRATAALFLFLFLAAAHACSSEEVDTTSAAPDPLVLNLAQLYSTVSSITVDVVYEPDAMPYTGFLSDQTPLWYILQGNLEGLFQGRAVSLFVPWDLDGMARLEDQARETWTTSEIIALARDLWDVPMTSSDAYVHILFLNGLFEDSGTINPQVLGVSFSGSSVIAVFKDVIVNSGSTQLTLKFVEQATLVHETGHLLGLVDNGVPMASDHADPDHSRHCVNPDCVMYWRNEGASDLRDFVRQFIDTGSIVLFCHECLEDVWSYKP